MSHIAQEISDPPEPDEPLVRVGSPSGLLGCIPFLMGFVPEESLVLVFMSPPPRRVVLTLRVDLEVGEDPVGTDILEEMLANTVERASAHGVELDLAHLLVFSEAAARLPAEDFVLDAADVLCHADVGVGEMFASDGERLWFYPGDDDSGCCPGSGHEVDRHEFDAAQFVLVTNGYGYLSSRGDLESVLSPVPQETFDDQDWQHAIYERAGVAARGADAERRWRRQQEDDMIAAFTHAEVDVDVITANAPTWALALADSRVREPLLYRLLVEPTAATRRPTMAQARAWLTALTVRCPERALAPVAATLAAVSWQEGDGAFARLAAERAQVADPSNSLAGLIAAASVSGVPPAAWLNILKAFGLEGLRRGDEQPENPDFMDVPHRA